MSKFSSGPSSSELKAQSEAAAEKERQKIAQETAIGDANRQQDLQASQEKATSARRQFLGQADEEITQRRKFLKAV